MIDGNPASPPEPRAGHDRRAFLLRSAAGLAAGGVVWAAPSILTIDAAAAASCGIGTHTLNWNTVGAGSGPGTYATGSGASLVNVTVGTAHSATSPASSGGGGSLGTNWTVVGGGTQIGNQTNPFWYMQMTATAVGQYLETTFTFSKAVVGLTFTLFDIDINSNGLSWTDIVTVSAVNVATAANVNVAKPAGGTATLAGSGTTSASATGTTNVATNSTNGNATFTIPTAVTTVTVRFAAGKVTNPIQYVGISNLVWNSCA